MTTTPTAEPLFVRSLELLERELPPENVLTAVVNLNPGRAGNEGPALETRIQNRLRDLGVPRDRSAPLVSRLREAQQQTGKTRVFFLWPGGERSLAINLDWPDFIAFGKPALGPLLELIEAYPLTAIALVDHHWGRLFTLDLGWLTEHLRLENIPQGQGFRSLEPIGAVTPASQRERIPGHGMSRTTDNDQVVRTRPNQERLFMQALVDALVKLYHTSRFRQLVVAGTLEGIAAFKAELNHDLSAALIGEYPQPTDAPASRVLEESLAVLELARVDRHRRLLDDALEHGTRGMLETLTALQQGRVYHLLIANDGADLKLWRDTDPQSRYVFAKYPPQGQSPLSGQAVQAVSLHDVLAEWRERYGVQVSILRGEPARTLEVVAEGIAGLIRYGQSHGAG
jgi:hypothetical protein